MWPFRYKKGCWKGKGKEARLCFTGYVLMENRNGMVVDVAFTQATGTTKRDAALVMLEKVPGLRRVTVGAYKGYDTVDFVTSCREMNITQCSQAADLDCGKAHYAARWLRDKSASTQAC